MIRTWGYGVVGEDQSATGGSAFGVYQFYRHTLAVIVHGGDGVDDGLLARVVLRTMHDTAKELQNDDDEAEALREMLRTADVQADETRRKHGLDIDGLAISALWIAADHLHFGQSGPTVGFHLRGQRGRPLGDRYGRLVVGTGQGAPLVVEGPVPLQVDDVLVLASLSASSALSPRTMLQESWDMPQRSVRRTLEGLAGGVPDECIVVGVAMNKSPEFIRPTVPPNVTLLLQEMLAKRGRDDARDAVFREIVDEVHPEWGKGRFVEEQAPVQREKLEFKEVERTDDDDEPLSPWDEFLLGFIILRDKLFEMFRTERGRRQLNMASVALGGVFSLLLVAGLFLDVDALQESLTAEPVVVEDPSRFDVQDGQLVRGGEDQTAAASAEEGPVSTEVGDAATREVAREAKRTESPSVWRRLLGAALLAGALAGALWWRKKTVEAAEAERRRLKEEQLRALLDRAIVGQGDRSVGQKLLASDGRAALATLEAPGGGSELLLLVDAPPKYDPSEGDDLDDLSRPRTRVVDPRSIIECQLVKNLGHKMNKDGGRRHDWVDRLEVQIRMSDPLAPIHRVAVLHEATQPGTLAHFEALATAHHWVGLVHAQVHASSRGSDRDRLARLQRLVDSGHVTAQEFELVRRSLRARRTTYLAIDG